MTHQSLASVIQSYFLNYLSQDKGLQSSTIRSYRDSLRLFLIFVAGVNRRGVSKLDLEHLDYPAVQAFLHNMEAERGNAISTRNQRLAALHVFYEYLGRTVPEMLPSCAKVAAIPMKRCPLPEMTFLARDELEALFACIDPQDRLARRDRALLMLLYNTGARVSEVAQLTMGQLDLRSPAQVRLLGKGSKWRTCPLWSQTVRTLQAMLDERAPDLPPDTPGVRRNGPTADDALWHLQAHPPLRPDLGDFGQTYFAGSGDPACLSAHGRRPPARSRRGSQCHPQLAGTRQPGDDQPVCRDHRPHEGRCPEPVRTCGGKSGALP